MTTQRRWLAIGAALLLAMIVLGGTVRLTESGLSITEWAPILGTLPPLSAADWDRAFSLYQASPQFRLVNSGMDLEGFKLIFWPEYLHRLLGRVIGLWFSLPLAWFAWRRMIDRRLFRGILLLIGLGGLQGLVGWLMVQSGLVDAPRVSHLRLTVHLGMGLLLFAATVWLALSLERGSALPVHGLRKHTGLLTALVFTVILSGGLVAGLRAGHAFPTFPLMAGAWVPDGLLSLSPAYTNLFFNSLTVMFQHRVLALITVGVAWALGWRAQRAAISAEARRAAWWVAGLATVQVGLGIATVLLHVPVLLGALHQGNAALLLASTLVLHRALRWSGPLDRIYAASHPRGAEYTGDRRWLPHVRP
ncbi:MAG: COX15/CtaA family protein [Myxococcota bacterium]